MRVITVTGGATVTATMKLRATVQRQTILEAVRESCDHPTAEEVHRRVRLRLSNVSLGTVYRNLALLDRAGEIRELHLSGEPARFDGEMAPHDHVRCTRCGRIADVALGSVAELQAQAAERTGFRVDERRIEFIGRCPDCRRQAGN
jgi:Fur family ferric uptake transcriptional regulator